VKFEGKFDKDGFYGWLNPELPHAQRFDRARLLAGFVEVDEETYWYFLEMLPPMHYTSVGFAICEATTADVRLGFFKFDERYFAAYISDHDPAHTMRAKRAALADGILAGVVA